MTRVFRRDGIVALAALAALATSCSSGHPAGATAEHDRGTGTSAGVSAAGNPLTSTKGFYVDPGSNPAAWVNGHRGDARAARIKASIASRPMARWFGNWSGDITKAVSGYTAAAKSKGKLPILVAYNVPGRDCGGQSSGGAGSAAAYRTWISKFAAGIGKRPAVVVIEPDAVAQVDCLPNDGERKTRLALLSYAAGQFKAKAPNTWAYLDAGNAKWIPAATMAQRLRSAGVGSARGFAVNVSNYYTTAQSVAYAKAVNTALKAKYGYTRHFVVDTSRNGKGAKNGEWCNPAGRKLGTPSRSGGGADLLLWVKVPGDSDGSCGIGNGIPAGQFSPNLAMRLINGT
ncbi:glycoside hydrolase family 6 protein [Actinoallomurus purpureus]|uniref:glycoside hydrolase family 6 protein n=1 Tax=Actinoallomurus purpureus TaxID=478114 RepID=UPI002092963E|nr:glycoside hydrolase family 6 protein [Actinoallomurus purpureus]MCO6009850.1 glycoside hydrolase family 6 protein [Actinoallomurus purpureus]